MENHLTDEIIVEFDTKFDHINGAPDIRRICNGDCSKEFSLDDVRTFLRQSIEWAIESGYERRDKEYADTLKGAEQRAYEAGQKNCATGNWQTRFDAGFQQALEEVEREVDKMRGWNDCVQGSEHHGTCEVCAARQSHNSTLKEIRATLTALKASYKDKEK